MRRSKYRIILDMIASGETDAQVIADAADTSVDMVYQYRWRAAHPERFNALMVAYRRRKGQLPRGERMAQYARARAPLLKKINALQARGLSFGEIGDRLGITRNKVAGMLWRQKQEQLLRAEAA